MKYKWKVQPAPTGRYRSFDKRGWPTFEYDNGMYGGAIFCEDAYVPSRVREGTHRPLSLHIRDHSADKWRIMVAKKQFATLDEAKDALEKILAANPHFMPKE